eukprot:4592193-Pyramimonas_sp.AAC.1
MSTVHGCGSSAPGGQYVAPRICVSRCLLPALPAGAAVRAPRGWHRQLGLQGQWEVHTGGRRQGLEG